MVSHSFPSVSLESLDPYSILKGLDGYDYIVDVNLSTNEKRWMVLKDKKDPKHEIDVEIDCREDEEPSQKVAKPKKTKKTFKSTKKNNSPIDLQDELKQDEYLIVPPVPPNFEESKQSPPPPVPPSPPPLAPTPPPKPEEPTPHHPPEPHAQKRLKVKLLNTKPPNNIINQEIVPPKIKVTLKKNIT